MIVSDLHGSWVELRCYVCGCNATKEGDYFDAWAGLKEHIVSAHGVVDNAEEGETDLQQVLRTCVFQKVPTWKAPAIQMGRIRIPKIKFTDQKPAKMRPTEEATRAASAANALVRLANIQSKVNDGAGEQKCAMCPDKMEAGDAVQVCRLCGWSLCPACFSGRKESLAHYGCQNSVGLREYFELRPV